MGGLSDDPVTSVAELKRLKTEEAFRGLPYDDTRGNPTIGWGTKLPITKAEGRLAAGNAPCGHPLARLATAWKPYGGLNKARQGALLDMAYELGVVGVVGDPGIRASGDCDKPKAERPHGCGFHDMLAALERVRLGGGEHGGTGKRVGN